MDDLEQIGKPSSLTCPECAGALWEVGRQAPIRYRCHTGHAFTAKVLETLQRDTVEDAIGVPFGLSMSRSYSSAS